MRLSTLIAILIFFTSVNISLSDTFKVDVINNTAEIEPGTTVDLKTEIVNLTDQLLAIEIIRHDALPDDWTASMCIEGIGCLMPDDTSETTAVQANDTLDFDITITTGSDPGYGEVLVTFRDMVTNDMDTVIFSVTSAIPPTFEVMIIDSLLEGAPQETFLLYAKVINISDEIMAMEICRIQNDLPAGWMTSMCIEGIGCLMPDDSIETVAIQAGDTLDFDITFTTTDQAGQGAAQVRFTDMVSLQSDTLLFRVQTKNVQQYQVTIGDSSAQVESGAIKELGGMIHNLSDATLHVEVNRIVEDIPEGWSTSICLGSACYPPFTSSGSDSIPAGDSLKLSITFTTNGDPATGKVQLSVKSAGEADSTVHSFEVTTITTALEDERNAAPLAFELLGNYPNPFNSATTIRFQSTQALRDIRLSVFDLKGNLVFERQLTNLPSGRHQLNYNGIDRRGAELASGIYLYRLTMSGKSGQIFSKAGKMTLIK